MAWPEPITLRGSHATLEPLTHARRDELIEAVRDGELWKLWYTFVPSPDTVEAEIERRLEQQRKGTMVPFTIVDAATGKAAGMTSYMNIDAETKRLEIGSTWYRKSVQRTSMNTECKLLLLTHAFEVLDCVAVEFRTHFINHQSRRAIERLGAKLDGILRNHRRVLDGTLRDTVVYSIINSEWPMIRSHLSYQLTRERENQ
jgi:RimJ/RimL family protein N-acetyltransferase